jgi:hypothetical protein
MIKLFEGLNKNQTITDLNYENNFYKEKYMTNYISKTLKINKSIKKLDLSCNFIIILGNTMCDNGVHKIFQSLKYNYSLSSLNLYSNNFIILFLDNNISHRGYYNIINLNENTSLTEIILGGDIKTMNVKGYEYISEMIKSNKSIKIFDLSCIYFYKIGNSKICYSSMIFISDSLIANSTITNLDLSHNELNEESIKLLSTSLIKNSSILKLNLSGQLDDESMVYFSNMLKINNSLTSLYINPCLFSEEGLSLLSNALLKNKSINELNIGSNFIYNYDKLTNCLMYNSTITSIKIFSRNYGLDKMFSGILKFNHHIVNLNRKIIIQSKLMIEIESNYSRAVLSYLNRNLDLPNIIFNFKYFDVNFLLNH